MKIKAYIFSINSKDDSKFYVKASDGNSTIERVYSVDCSLNKAELYAAQFVALCHRFPKEIEIITDSWYLENILCKGPDGKWFKENESDFDILIKTREIYEKIEFRISVDEQEINKMRSLIKVS